MNVKDMREFIKDLPDDTRLCMAVGETTCNGKQICVFADIKQGVGYDLKQENRTEIVFLNKKEEYIGFIDRKDLIKNLQHAHWD